MLNRRFGNAPVIAAVLSSALFTTNALADEPEPPVEAAEVDQSAPEANAHEAPAPIAPRSGQDTADDGSFTTKLWINRAAHDELVALRKDSLDTRRQLQTSVLASGIVSIVAGVAMSIPDDYDQGIRYAGFNTIGFGVINTIVGGVALYGIDQERKVWEYGEGEVGPTSPDDYRRYRDHALADESREAWGHGINLGLAGAYAAIGGMAIVVSQLDDVDHPNRWLGSGVAIAAQAAHLAVVDLVGSVKAREFEERMREITPAVSYEPTSGNTYAGVSYSAQF